MFIRRDKILYLFTEMNKGKFDFNHNMKNFIYFWPFWINEYIFEVYFPKYILKLIFSQFAFIIPSLPTVWTHKYCGRRQNILENVDK